MKLTKSEKAWVAKLNAVLSECTSTRLGFATIGDHDLTIFDQPKRDKIEKAMERDNGDFVPTAIKLGLVADERIYFPNAVESTAG